uniref:Uncharacterized protein n=1 Tax=Anguilla anguilla TaxID=7936 RepID=A0A0E9U912_ANGAN
MKVQYVDATNKNVVHSQIC